MQFPRARLINLSINLSIDLRRRMARVLCAGAALTLALSAAPLYAVSVTVDVNSVRAVLPLEGLGMGTAVYANQFANANLYERLN